MQNGEIVITKFNFFRALIIISTISVANLSVAVEIKSQTFTNVKSCFDPPFDNFESWTEMLSQKKDKIIPPDVLVQMKDQYSHFRNLIICENFEYNVAGYQVKGFYIAPISSTKKIPLIIYNRGGNRNYGSVFFGYQLFELFPLAERGFAIVGSQYRGTNFKSILNLDEFGGNDVQDVLKLVDIADQFPRVDSSRIGMYGTSRGGMMSYLAAKETNKLSAIVVQAGDTDLVASLAVRPEMERVYKDCIPNYASTKTQALYARSAIKWVEKLPKNVPILLLHGMQDDRVPTARSIEMAARLKELNRVHKLVLYPNDGHTLNNHHDEALNEISSWFKKYFEHRS